VERRGRKGLRRKREDGGKVREKGNERGKEKKGRGDRTQEGKVRP